MIDRQGDTASVPATPEQQAAQQAGLIYVDDRKPGIRRIAADEGFRYVGKNGMQIIDESILARLRSLAIPPAWQDVWICASPNGHVQATGRDARRRKQYRYHDRWRDVRDATKFERTHAFGLSLPAIQRRVDRDLRRPGLPRDKVLAVIVRLLEKTLIRVGNEEYARDNASFGLTTLRNRHVDVKGDRLDFSFVGKSGVRHRSNIDDPQLARVVKRCKELPGQELFQYLDETGEQRFVGSADVNDYLRSAAGADFTAKDYRTWAGSLLAFCALRQFDDEFPQAQRVVQVIKEVACRLGNTPAICRKCYVHPAVLSSYLEGKLKIAAIPRTSNGLKADEAAFIRFIARYTKAQFAKASA